MLKLLVAIPLKKSEAIPTPTLPSSQLLWRAILQYPFHIFCVDDKCFHT